jgi:catechol 2,3-dioxygenase-like lactoylglutathione lyase family enzyme
VPASRVSDLIERLAADGFDADRWREDHPDERSPGAYRVDPGGNLVQISEGSGGIDHVALEINNFDYAEYFYGSALGCSVDYYHGWRAEDYASTLEDDGANDEMAPWTRRDRGSYRDKGQRIARPNAQVFYRLGSTRLGLFIATAMRQQPPEETLRGTPRVVLRANRNAAEVALRLADFPFRFEREDSHFFLRDPSGNFVELECEEG